jgi:tetratricopeptide (TPR) repeat protein
MMDCCFLLEQYDRAKEIFDLCKSQLSQEEVEVLENKILAHVAMKAGNYEEALTRFKVFTETLRKKKRDEYDHIHGETVPYEALMGLNMKRIGELFALKGDSASAVKAYEEAKTYYQQAAGKVEKNGYWCMRIDEDLKVLEQKISQAKK